MFEAECKEKGQSIGETSSELSRNVKVNTYKSTSERHN